ncbi:7-carboxy-7-deazaguanine synthase QueE [Candidatus Aminicenantes bacterium AC-335-B20]|nr:7-carboxy-7-deazaguanine synthase QueE [SCandidatus Aminicenantes bacterium Aminicenantia_JdfR_composite]MCP2596783.1 7-carboxy-7-deazaguanine synthase QueE [Candidatus Aminicenantes bacterium AC-335-G13]MCP2599048.1 7-carboxy-7-deazaguanine synthase QueE [Candidatus Aminicenantes bacterium AC-335-B20]MCP2605569.1 7-carboxy-7-deazaguanine synthase QueE [Candidatus Aminicenantes bacterium AC-335-O07]MCP2617893.1 7-carboxy-7-deazaguanine synthase QueE [Candidatus Aminicenantes bacterium AC-335
MKISEIFWSVQGEGLRIGEPTIFIRLTGCNLQCEFCDTKYAWEGGIEVKVETILNTVRNLKEKHNTEWICLTGGEPLIQDIRTLVHQLKSENFKIQIETNGTRYIDIPVDWYSLSPKPEEYFYQPKYKGIAKEVKLIVIRNLKSENIIRIRKEFPKKIPLFLQPCSNQSWSYALARKLLQECIEKGFSNIRLGLQLHRIYKIK